jgi:hypothetical protein
VTPACTSNKVTKELIKMRFKIEETTTWESYQKQAQEIIDRELIDVDVTVGDLSIWWRDSIATCPLCNKQFNHWEIASFGDGYSCPKCLQLVGDVNQFIKEERAAITMYHRPQDYTFNIMRNSDWGRNAVRQLLSKLNIPERFFLDKLSPQLRQEVIDYRVKEKADTNILIRQINEEDFMETRAILSSRYPIFNHDRVFSIIDSTIDKTKFTPYNIMYHADYLRVRLLSTDPRWKVAIDGYNEINLGIEIGNSEIGRMNLWVRIFLWSVICKNGMVWLRDIKTSRMKHLAAEDLTEEKSEELAQFLEKKIKDLIDAAPNIIEEFLEAISYEISYPQDTKEIFEAIQERERFPKKYVEEMTDNYNRNPNPIRPKEKHSLYDVAMAINNQSWLNTLDMTEQATMQDIASKLIARPRTYAISVRKAEDITISEGEGWVEDEA